MTPRLGAVETFETDPGPWVKKSSIFNENPNLFQNQHINFLDKRFSMFNDTSKSLSKSLSTHQNPDEKESYMVTESNSCEKKSTTKRPSQMRSMVLEYSHTKLGHFYLGCSCRDFVYSSTTGLASGLMEVS